MATESSVMAVIRASRPSFRNPHDKLAFAVHSTFLAAGYALIAVGSSAFSDNPPTEGDEVGIEGWNDQEDAYGFVYSKTDKGSKKAVLVKCLAIGDVLAVDVLNLEEQQKEPFNLQISVKDHVVDGAGGMGNYGEMYRNLKGMVENLNSGVLAKLEPKADASSSASRVVRSDHSSIGESAERLPYEHQQPPSGKMASELNNETSRANWRNMDLLKFFLETCVQEVSQNGRQGGSLKMESWERVRLALKNAFRVELTQRQLKNHYDYMKDKYQAWVPLTLKTGNIYNPETHAITMTNAEWEDYIKIHPKAKTLRAAPLPFPEICRALFDGAAATGRGGWGPTSRLPRQETESQADVEVLGIDELEDSLQEETLPSPVIQSNASTSCADGPRKKKKKCTSYEADESMSKWVKEIVEASKEQAAATAAANAQILAAVAAPAAPHASMKNCVEKLNKVGWPKNSPLYSAAVGIFGMSGDHRDAWMCMDDDPSCLQGWVMAVGSVIGFKF